VRDVVVGEGQLGRLVETLLALRAVGPPTIPMKHQAKRVITA
jgi:hypothetical protein